jgi:hypothetical protein
MKKRVIDVLPIRGLCQLNLHIEMLLEVLTTFFLQLFLEVNIVRFESHPSLDERRHHAHCIQTPYISGMVEN